MLGLKFIKNTYMKSYTACQFTLGPLTCYDISMSNEGLFEG